MKKQYLAAALAAALIASSASAAGGGSVGFNIGLTLGYTCSKNPPVAPGCGPGGCLPPYGWSPYYAPPAMYSALGQGVGYSPWVMPQAQPFYGYDYGYAGYGHAPVGHGHHAMPGAVVPGKVIEQAPAPKELNNTPPKKDK